MNICYIASLQIVIALCHTTIVMPSVGICQNICNTDTFVYKMSFLLSYELQQLTMS
jgi:hypothetical protein